MSGCRPSTEQSSTHNRRHQDGGRQRRILERGLWRRRALLGIPVALAAAAAGEAQLRPVMVFAAASLKNALDAIAGKWRAESGNSVTISYAASSTLAKQIENG